jgi:hypothetical protein
MTTGYWSKLVSDRTPGAGKANESRKREKQHDSRGVRITVDRRLQFVEIMQIVQLSRMRRPCLQAASVSMATARSADIWFIKVFDSVRKSFTLSSADPLNVDC